MTNKKFSTSSYPPTLVQVCLSSSWGGQEMVAFEMAESFQKKGFQPILVTTLNSALEKKAKENHIETISFTKRKHFHLKLSWALHQLAKNNSNLIIMSHQLSDLWIITPALIGLKNKLIGFSHTFVNYKKKNFFYKWLYSRLNHLIVLTSIQKLNILDHHSIDENKVVIIPNAVDTIKFSPDKRSQIFENKYNCPPGACKIALVGRLDPQKGQEEVVLACKEVLKSNSNFQVYIIGTDTINSPGTTDKIKKLIKTEKLETHIHLLGHCENIAELMASCDFKVMPSYSETFGRVVIEAMACGCPVLATNAGGVPEIIEDGKNGLLCEPKNIQSLKEKMLLLINDSNLRQSFRSAGLKTVEEKYKKEIVESKIEKLLKPQSS